VSRNKTGKRIKRGLPQSGVLGPQRITLGGEGAKSGGAFRETVSVAPAGETFRFFRGYGHFFRASIIASAYS
jgi:hypothetical protein